MIAPLDHQDELLRAVYLRDLTEIRTAAAKLDGAKSRAEAANQAKTRFLASMSHEIRTPLGAVIGYADLLRRFPLNPGRADWIERLRQSADHLLGLMNDLLDLSQIEAGQLKLVSTSIDPTLLLSEVEAVLRPKAKDKGLELTLDVNGAIPAEIQTDPLRLRQILINLLGNAVKFTNEGSIRLRMTLVEDASLPTLKFEVSDTGVGIHSDRLEEIFRPFSQVRQTEAHQRDGLGAGLGLDISIRLARLLGGDLTARSELGTGSTLTLVIPIGPLKTNTLTVTAPVTFAPSTSNFRWPDLSAFRVLVVDDSHANRDLIRFWLEHQGAVAELCGDGEQAVSAVLGETASGPFDVILMDVQMPRLDGFAATRALRKAGVTTPIIAITARSLLDDRKRCLEAGYDAYLAKPLSQRALSDCLATVLSERDEFSLAPTKPPVNAPTTRSDPRLIPLIIGYTITLGQMADTLESADQAGDVTGIDEVLHRLAGTAASYGFSTVAQLTERCLQYARSGWTDEARLTLTSQLITELRAAASQNASVKAALKE
jgi:hypothetical protein